VELAGRHCHHGHRLHSFWTLVSALVISLIGILVLRHLAGRCIRVLVAGIVLVSVLTSMAGVSVIAYRMLSGVNQDVVLDLMAIAGLAGLIVAPVVGRQLIKASWSISDAVQGVGDSGVYIAPQRTLPAELAELSEALTVAYDRLAQARSRERALEASRRELVAWVSHDLRTPAGRAARHDRGARGPGRDRPARGFAVSHADPP
jgi:signal transduction histidine kinase